LWIVPLYDKQTNMLKSIFNALGFGPKEDLTELIANGALVVDVRTKQEYANGSGKGSINIPLNDLGKNLKKLKNKDQAIITCCASGMRSASAKSFLKQNGYTNVHNGGSWSNVDY
jgi:phage shock protein E